MAEYAPGLPTWAMPVAYTCARRSTTGGGTGSVWFCRSPHCCPDRAVYQGPELMACGFLHSPLLRSYKARLIDVAPHALVSPAPDLKPSFRLDVSLAGTLSIVKALRCVISDTKTREIVLDEQVEFTSEVGHDLQGVVDCGDLSAAQHPVKLWWPVGYGTQEMYEVEVHLLDEVGSL